MRTVDSSKYNTDYFQNVLLSVDYSNKVTISDFKPLHQHISSLVEHKKNDLIVDYGCGNGDLAFLLTLKYKCKIIGIDYSKDAIQIANENRKMLSRTKSLDTKYSKFICCTIDATPKSFNQQVSTVYLADVVEHLYDPELTKLVKVISRWNKSNLQIVVHTDNNVYIQYVRPVIDMIAILTRKTRIDEILERNRWEKERHVNLTTPTKLSHFFRKHGYVLTKLEYSPLTKQNIRSQLGALGEYSAAVAIVFFLGKMLRYLLPSFYAVYKRAPHNRK